MKTPPNMTDEETQALIPSSSSDKIVQRVTFNCPDCDQPCIITKVQTVADPSTFVEFRGVVTKEGLRIDLFHPGPYCDTYLASEQEEGHVPEFMRKVIAAKTAVTVETFVTVPTLESPTVENLS